MSAVSEPSKALEQAATAAEQTESVEPAEKAGEEKTDPATAEEKPRNLSDQSESAEAPAKIMVKAVPLETADITPKEEQTPEKTAQEKSEELPPSEKNNAAEHEAAAESDRSAVKSRAAAESRSAADFPQNPDADAKEPFFSLPDDAPVIRKPESGKKEEEEAIPARRVPNVPAMILFFKSCFTNTGSCIYQIFPRTDGGIR